MGYGVPIVWSAREQRMVDACVRAVVAGKYDSISSAARDCFDRLIRLRRGHPGAQSPQAPKTLSGLHHFIWNQTRGRRLHGRETFWTEAEERLVGRYVQGLLRGRYRTAEVAAKACQREFARLRRLQSDSGWSVVPRTLRAVHIRIAKRSRAAGRSRWRVPYTPAELGVFDRYARAVAGGQYRDLMPAATDCLKDLAWLRDADKQAAPLPRPFKTVRNQISLRAHKLGWSWSAERWRPDEQRIVERHVRDLTGSGSPSISQAARDCRAELGSLHKRLGKKNQSLRSSYRRRTFLTIRSYLEKWSRDKGRKTSPVWTPQENEIAVRYARALLDGRYAEAHAATRDCWRDLVRLRRRWRTDEPGRFKRTRSRTLGAAYSHVCRLAHRLNERWPKTRWTDAELKLCRQWIRWYDRHRGVRRLRPWDTVASGLQEELERLGSRRTLTACRARLWKEWEVRGT